MHRLSEHFDCFIAAGLRKSIYDSFTVNSSCVERLEAAVTSQQSPAGLPPTAASSRTDDDQVTLPQELVDQITKLVIKRAVTLVAVSRADDESGVWI